ncbi:MAG TPA: flavodoxin family protein [Syntrophorhabdaceae bacterium]|nr:flavodoxin family protein [Syntrophorhabdaceae bacterium]
MKKVLGVVGSPRKKGNTNVLVARVLEGAHEAGAQTETVFLNEARIEECDGCHACWKTGTCKRKDDMNDLYPKIIGSDVIVFGTPVYWYGPTALMKGFIDRFVYFNCPENRTKIRCKRAVLAVPFEENDPDTALPLVEFFNKSLGYLEMSIVGRLIVPGVTVRGEIAKKTDCMREAYELGKGLV